MTLPTNLITLDGTALATDAIEGKVVLFVNVASKCGLTPQYSGLVELNQKYPELMVIGVPCNQFMEQEPGSPEEIKEFTANKYKVDFTLLQKQDVNGDNRSPLYQFLVGEGEDVEWNFGKFIVGKDGAVVGRFDPKTPPNDPSLTKAIETALGV